MSRGRPPAAGRAVTAVNWIHRTGYAPAYEHVGRVLIVDAAGRPRIPTGQPVEVGQVRSWRAGCSCGWNGIKTYPRDRFPSPSWKPPAEVDGSGTRTGAWAEWRQHVFAAVPELIVADTINVARHPVGSVLTHPIVACSSGRSSTTSARSRCAGRSATTWRTYRRGLVTRHAARTPGSDPHADSSPDRSDPRGTSCDRGVLGEFRSAPGASRAHRADARGLRTLRWAQPARSRRRAGGTHPPSAVHGVRTVRPHARVRARHRWWSSMALRCEMKSRRAGSQTPGQVWNEWAGVLVFPDRGTDRARTSQRDRTDPSTPGRGGACRRKHASPTIPRPRVRDGATAR
jgi:hypothetical protein